MGIAIYGKLDCAEKAECQTPVPLAEDRKRVFIIKIIKKAVISIFIVLIALVALFAAVMILGKPVHNFISSHSHSISVVTIVPFDDLDEGGVEILQLDNGNEAYFVIKCDDTSQSIYQLSSSDDRVSYYLDTKQLLCTFPEDYIFKQYNSVYEKGVLLSIGQKWKKIKGPYNYYDQPTRNHLGDVVFKISVTGRTVNSIFETRAKERILYTNFSTVITYFDGRIIYYDLNSGEVLKSLNADYMKKNCKHIVQCLGDTLTISNESVTEAEINIE